MANYGLPLLSVPIISRILGPQKYGIINFSATLTAYFILLISYSFDLIATREVAKDPYNLALRNTVFNEVLQSRIILFFFAAAIFTITVIWFLPSHKQTAVFFFSFLICIATCMSPNWLLQAMQDLTKVALFSFVSNLIFTITIVLIIREEDDYYLQPLALSIVQVTSAFASLLWAKKKYKLRFQLVSFEKVWSLLKRGKTVFFSLILISLYTTTNIFVLGLYQSPLQVGYFTAAQRLIIIAQSVLSLPLANSFFPYIGRAFSINSESGIRKVQKMIPFVICFTGTVSCVMLLLGPFVLPLFYGIKFRPAIVVFEILAFIPLIVSINNILGVQMMLNLGMDKSFFKISALGGTLSIISNILAVGKWGYVATAVNWLLTELFITVLMYLSLLRSGINPINPQFFKFSLLYQSIRPLFNLQSIFRNKA